MTAAVATKQSEGEIYITVNHGMRGYFAVKMDDEGAVQSSELQHETLAPAVQEAKEWAAAEGLRFVP